MPGYGACPFPCDPDVPATDAPALWQPASVPAIIILDEAPDDFGTISPDALNGLRDVAGNRSFRDGRHLVVRDPGGHHRIWARPCRPGKSLAFLLPVDTDAGLRLAAAERFERLLRGTATGPAPPGWRMTPFQRLRLTLLLHILDARRAGASHREIAMSLIYPKSATLTGAAWKGSPERRRTQRLIDEAVALMQGGYRSLLRGR